MRKLIAILTSSLILGAGLAAPNGASAADGTSSSTSGFSLATPWLCYSRLAGYRWFQYSNCTGKYYRY